MLSVTLIQLGSECDPEPVPRPMGIRTLSQYPKWSLCTPTSISSSVSAIDSSPKRDTPCRLTLSLSRYQSKEPPGSRAAHGTQHGQTGPCGCLPSHRGLQLQEKPVSTHGLIGFKLLSGQLRAFGCRGGKRRATHAEWSRRQEGSVTARGGSADALPAPCLPLQYCPSPGSTRDTGESSSRVEWASLGRGGWANDLASPTKAPDSGPGCP